MRTKQKISSLSNKKNAELQQAWDQIAEGYNHFVTDTEIWLANEGLNEWVCRQVKLFWTWLPVVVV